MLDVWLRALYPCLAPCWGKAGLLHVFLMKGDFFHHSEHENDRPPVAKDIWDLPSHLPFLWDRGAVPPFPAAWIQGFPLAEGGRWGYLGSLQPWRLQTWHSANPAYHKPFLISKMLWWKRKPGGDIKKKMTHYKCTFLRWSTDQSLFLLLIQPASRHFCKEYWLHKTNTLQNTSFCWKADFCVFQFCSIPMKAEWKIKPPIF